MTRKLIICLALLSLAPACLAQRTIQNWNFGWKFHLGAVDPKNIDTTAWRTVDVPHDFQIEQPWVEPSKNEKANNSDGAANVKSRLSARGFKEMGEGWYVKYFTPGKDLKGKRVLLDFQGIMYVGDVYLNGQRIGGTDYGYLGFEIDVSKLLNYGQQNILAVRASTANAEDSRWYTGGGLYRDVHLVVTNPELYFVRHPLQITTKNNREVDLQIELANYTRDSQVDLAVNILDRNGHTAYSKRTHLPFFRRQHTNELKWEPINIDNAHLWDTRDPYLYTAQVTLYNKDGKAIDNASCHFGIRTVEIGPSFGLKLNGKKVLLKGIANHHTLGALGAAAYQRAIEKRLHLLKDFGFNHIRTSHNPYSQSFLDLCDSLGFLVVDELYDKWLQQFTGGRRPWLEQWSYELPEWIKRDRNHPCVVFWSLGNELQTYANLPFNDWGVTPYKMLKTVLQRYDNSRKTTVAMHPRGRNWQTDSLPCDLAMVTDIQAYNYRYPYFETDGRRFPWMTFYQSEANLSMMGPNYFGMNLNKVIGLAYWGMIDYLGESRGWPAKGWTDGVFDISLQPKPTAWLLRSMFKPDEPICHIAIIESKAHKEEWNGIVFNNDGMSENWNRKPGSTLSLKVFTNADRVDLWENGKKIAEQNNTDNPKTRNQLRFDNISYQPGYIEAVAYKDGKQVARHRLETTGKAEKLVLAPDNETWHADGTDLQHVRVLAVDRKGRRVWSCQDQLAFTVDGDARIVAVDNGDMSSNELNVGYRRKLFNGSALVILRAGQKPGKVKLTTQGGGKKATLHLTTK